VPRQRENRGLWFSRHDRAFGPRRRNGSGNALAFRAASVLPCAARRVIWPEPVTDGLSPRELSNLRRRIAAWGRRWRLPGLAARVAVVVSPRLRRALGRCVPAGGVVRLHPALFGPQRALLPEVLCHEVAHVAVRARHRGYRRPHGPEWAALMRAAGFSPRASLRIDLPAPRRDREVRDPSSTADARPRAGRRYLHRCPVCGMTRTARRPVPAWRCAACVVAGLDRRLVVERQECR